MTTDPLGLAGQPLGDYNVDRYRGGGAFGAVYRATHAPTAEVVALKILTPTASLDARREFANEGELLLRAESATRVVDIFDTATETLSIPLPGGGVLPVSVPYHVLEHADGCLEELVANLADLDWASRLSLFRDVVLGAHQLHRLQIIHRDLKAANVLLFERGGVVTAKLNDLGRSRDLSQSAAASPQSYEFGRGDPNFAPPEFLWGAGNETDLTHRCSDLYGLGSLIVELTLGHGASALALFPNAATINHHRTMSSTARRATYRSSLPLIRSWYTPVLDMASSGIPSAIRPQLAGLVRQLCDPDPFARLPRIAPGRRGPRHDDLHWLLNRTDSIILTLRNAEREALRLSSRKAIVR